MTKEEIFQAIIRNLTEILPELEGSEVKIRDSMKDHGANSVDRVDVIISTMTDCGLRFPLNEVGKVENIQGLVDFLHAKFLEKGG